VAETLHGLGITKARVGAGGHEGERDGGGRTGLDGDGVAHHKTSGVKMKSSAAAMAAPTGRTHGTSERPRSECGSAETGERGVEKMGGAVGDARAVR